MLGISPVRLAPHRRPKRGKWPAVFFAGAPKIARHIAKSPRILAAIGGSLPILVARYQHAWRFWVQSRGTFGGNGWQDLGPGGEYGLLAGCPSGGRSHEDAWGNRWVFWWGIGSHLLGTFATCERNRLKSPIIGVGSRKQIRWNRAKKVKKIAENKSE